MHHRLRRRLSPVALFGLVLFCAAAPGCGPIEYVHQVTYEASAEVAAARAAEAEKRAPYYFTRAVEYLEQAKIEAAEADYQAATRFGAKAEEAAREARKQALAREASGPENGPR